MGLTALAAPCATRPLRPYSAQRNARDQRAHTCRRAEGEQSRERVNPVAIIAWRLRLFVPAAEDRGPPILAALLKRHPLLGARARAAA